MTDIYEQHAAAFSRVSAYIILDAAGERVATVALKFPADGAGRLFAYFHLFGVPMVRAYAGGGGYDKRSAAVRSAVAKAPAYSHGDVERYGGKLNATRAALQAALSGYDGEDWTRSLEKAGFQALQAV